LVAHANDVSQWNRLAGELGGDRSTEKAILVEDADLTHVPRVEADRSIFANVCRESKRQVPKSLEVDAITTDFASTNFMHEEQIELFQRIWHPGKECSLFPAFGRRGPALSAGTKVVDLQKEMAKLVLESVERKARGAALVSNVAVKIAEKHLVDGSKEALDTTAATRLAWYRKHKTNLQIGSDLLDAWM
jgi:hypothetical protein